MDDALLNRWKQGEPQATTAVRNAIRTVAERVLSNPALRNAEGTGGRALVSDEERRRELTSAVAKEVMERGGDSANTVTALALMVSARHVIEALRVGRPLAGTAHLPPPVAVSCALAPASMAAAQRDASNRHLESCKSCADDVRLVREVVRSASTVVQDTSAAAIEEAVAATAADAMAQAVQDAADDVEDGPNEAPAPRETRPTRPSRPSARPPRRGEAAAEPSGGFFKAAWPLLVLLALGAWYAWSRHQDALHAAVLPQVAALANRTPPALVRGEKAPAYVEDAMRDLARGDCLQAAARFRTARRQHPDDRRVWVLEGASFVCAGDGAAALQPLDIVAREGEPTPAIHWYRAQALLLEGRAADALELLEKVAASDNPHRAAAKPQIDQIRAILD